VFGEHKFGGNAQSISKDRWLHHTSFLWDFNPSNMEYLAHPKRQPSYRAQRSHLDFLCRLKDFISTKNDFAQHLQEELDLQFDVEEIALDTLKPLQEEEHRRATRFIQLNIE
jgi:lipoate-protein ligase A